MEYNLELYFFWVAFPIAVIALLSVLVFGRMSMAPIEKRIKKDGLPRPCPWDGPGARIFWYAWAIALPVGSANREDDPLINVPLVRSYATKGDVSRAIAFMVAQTLFAIMLIFFVVLDIGSL